MGCRDTGCDDFGRAARNRKMVANKENIIGYLWVEAVVKSHPHGKPLPEWVPQGSLPIVGKHEIRNFERYGFHIIDEEELE